MRPTDPDEVDRLLGLVTICEVSRSSRRSNYQRLRSWYERGTDQGNQATYNKLFAHLSLVSSFLFSPGTVRFGVHLSPSVREQWLDATMIARDEFRQVWADSKSDLMLVQALEWALAFGAVPLKLQNTSSSGFRLGLIMPNDFGVGREDIADLDEQDAICHWYSLSLPQIERWVQDQTDADRILDEANAHAFPASPNSTRDRLVVSQVTGVFPAGVITGGFPGEPSMQNILMAEVIEPTVQLVDLWERRRFRRTRPNGEKEVFDDWLVTTFIAGGRVVIAQRRNPDLPSTPLSLSLTLPAELPFVMLTPRPVPDYFWGRSELDNLTLLQDWINDHHAKIRQVINTQLNPPKFFSGISESEEAGRAMSTEGGSFSSPEPNARMDRLVPPLTPESLRISSIIEQMFADTSGIPQTLSEPGQMPGGIRSTGHFSMAAGIGAGRVREMALVVEEALGDLATKAFHLLQRNNTEVLRKADGSPFLLSQIPYLVSLSVNAHSASPIFAEQTQAKALLLNRAGAIGPDDFVELIDPVNREELKVKAKELAKQKSQLQRELLRIQEEKATRGTRGKTAGISP